MKITTPKLLEYTMKAVMLADPNPLTDYVSYWKYPHMKFEQGQLKVSFTRIGHCTGWARVMIGDYKKYPAFIDKMLTILNKYTGRTYTIEDLKK